VVTGGDVSDEKRREDRVQFELSQGLSNCLIGFHADAFLDQLRSKQGARLPILAS
jgi:hypothetical protein